MTTLAQRFGLAIARLVDRGGTDLALRASPGFGFTSPSYQFDRPEWGDSNIGDYRKAFASTIAVYACVAARGGGVASAPLKVYQDVQGNRKEIPNHPLRMLMQRPNEMMSEAEFLLTTQTLMDATGFAAIQKVRNNARQVISLWHLRSDWLREIKRKQAASDWQYEVPDGKRWTIPAEDVLIISGGPSTDLGSRGLSPIAVALREVKVDSSLTDFLKMFIDSGAVPRQAIVMEDAIDDEEYGEELKAKFQDAYGGFKNWSKVALLSGGMKIEKIGGDLNELAYSDLRFLTEAHVCAAFQVPPIVANMQVGLEAATYSNYEQARKAFFESTIKMLWDRLDGAFTRGLLPEFETNRTVSVEFDKSEVPALREDADKLWTRASDALSRGGITLNQYQDILGRPGFGPSGDVIYLPLGVEPIRPDDLGKLADLTAEPPQPIPPALVDANADPDAKPAVVDPDDDDDTDRARRQTRRFTTLSIDARSRIASSHRRQVNRLTTRYLPRLVALFRKQGEIVAAAVARKSEDASLAAIRASLSDEGNAAAALSPARLDEVVTRAAADIPWDDLDAQMTEELRGLFVAAGKLAFLSASTTLNTDIPWDPSNPKVRRILDRLATRIVGINETTRANVRSVIASGIEEGLKLEEIADNLRGLYRETYKNRSLAIARTESQVGYNLSTARAYAESNIVASVQCLDNPEHTDHYDGALDGLSCSERNGIVVDPDDVEIHIFSEHPNGTLAVTPVLVRPLGDGEA